MVRVGLCLPQLGEHVTAAGFSEFCRRAEAAGFSSLWAQEHLFFPLEPRSGYAAVPGLPIPPQYRSVLAPTEAMAHAAAITDRVTIGSSILVGGYHRPVELAQRIATLDLLSGGRTILGLAVGWSDDEHEQMDVDPRTRGRRLEELVRAVLACWGPDPVRFDGEFFSIPESVVQPKPLQQPHPPLLSGMWSPAGLDRTVALFDIWNPARGNPEEIALAVAGLNAKRRSDQAPLRLFYRSFAQRPNHQPGTPIAGVEGVAEEIRSCARAGVEEVIVECNFWDAMDSPDAWAAAPDTLAPLLEAAAAG
jgi:probable F420-dependent oxidoreductase